MLRFLLLLLLSVVSNGLTGQTANGTAGLAVHFDKPFYVTGEVIWYDLYLPPAFAGKEVTLKVLLTTPEGKRVEEYFLATAGAINLDASIKLPYELESAMYRFLILAVETSSRQWLKLSEVFLPIYNDLLQEVPGGNVTERFTTPVTAAGDLTVSIRPASGPYQKRQAIEAVIEVKDAAGKPVAADLSVSVVDADLLGPGTSFRSDFKGGGSNTTYRPEDLASGIFVNGQVTDGAGQARGATAVGAYQADSGQSFVFETETDGRFSLPLPDFRGRSDLQFVDLRGDALRVNLDEGIPLSPAPALPYNEVVSNYLKWSQSRKVIYQLYNTVETPLEQEVVSIETRSFTPDQRLLLKDYTAFKDFNTFFTEVSTPLKVRLDKNGAYSAQMFNPNPRMRVFYQGTPLFIVDGKITRDVNFIQSLDWAEIDTIDLHFDFFNLNTYFGKLGSSGVVILKTRFPQLMLPADDAAGIFSVAGYQPGTRAINEEVIDSNRPVFKPQVFWAPDIRTDAAGRATIRFAQSDDLGTFLIKVVARSRDGRLGYGNQTYEVQW